MLNHRLPARATRATSRGSQTTLAGTVPGEAGARLNACPGFVDADMASLRRRGRCGGVGTGPTTPCDQRSRRGTKPFRGLADTSGRGHKLCLWGFGGDGVVFEEEEE